MIDYLIVGFISVIVCYLIINILISSTQKIQLNNIKTYIVAFIIGLTVHLVCTLCNIDSWYDDKKYLTAIKMLSMN
jgi:hypothetical protein